MNSLCHNYIKRVTNGGILYLATDPDISKGQDCHRLPEEHPGKVHDVRKLTAIGVELETEKAAINRVRGGRKRRSHNGLRFLPKRRFMTSIPVPTFCDCV